MSANVFCWIANVAWSGQEMCVYTIYVRMFVCVCARARYIHYATHLKLVKVRSVPTRKIHHGTPQHELARDDEVTSG